MNQNEHQNDDPWLGEFRETTKIVERRHLFKINYKTVAQILNEPSSFKYLTKSARDRANDVWLERLNE